MKKKKFNLSKLISGQSFKVDTSAFGVIYINYLSASTVDTLQDFIKEHPDDHLGLIRKLITHVGTLENPFKNKTQRLMSENEAEQVTDDELNQVAKKLFESWVYLVDEKLDLENYPSYSAGFSALLQKLKDESDLRIKQALDVATGADLAKKASAALNHSELLEAALKNIGVGPIAELNQRFERDYQSMLNQLGIPDTFTTTALGKYFEKVKKDRQKLLDSVQSIREPYITQAQPNLAEILNLQTKNYAVNLFGDEMAKAATSIYERLGIPAHKPWANALEFANSFAINPHGDKLDAWRKASESMLSTAEQAQEILKRFNVPIDSVGLIDNEDLKAFLQRHNLPTVEEVLEDPEQLAEIADKSLQEVKAAPTKANAMSLGDIVGLAGLLLSLVAYHSGQQSSRKIEKLTKLVESQNQNIITLIQANENTHEPGLGQVQLKNPSGHLHLRTAGSIDAEVSERIPNEKNVVIIQSKNNWLKIKVEIDSRVVSGWVFAEHINRFN